MLYRVAVLKKHYLKGHYGMIYRC